MNINTSSRELFEESVQQELEHVVTKAKKLRQGLRLLEADISQKEDKIKNYQTVLQELQQELVKLQAILYAKGTT